MCRIDQVDRSEDTLTAIIVVLFAAITEIERPVLQSQFHGHGGTIKFSARDMFCLRRIRVLVSGGEWRIAGVDVGSLRCQFFPQDMFSATL